MNIAAFRRAAPETTLLEPFPAEIPQIVPQTFISTWSSKYQGRVQAIVSITSGERVISTSTPSLIAIQTSTTSSTMSASILPLSTPIPTTLSSGAVQAAATTSPTSVTSSKTPNSNNALLAGIAVLAGLLALAIGAIVYLIWQRRRNSSRIELPPKEIDLQSPQPPSGWSEKLRQASVTSLEDTVVILQRQLQAKDHELHHTKSTLQETSEALQDTNEALRDTKAAILPASALSGLPALSDQQIKRRFAALADGIENWVMTAFKNFIPTESPNSDVIASLLRISPDYKPLLRNHATQHLVLRALVADVIAQAFTTDQFFGDVAFSELKQEMSVNSTATDLNEWRAMTICLLAKTPSYHANKAEVVEDLARKIDLMAMSITSRKRSKQRLAHLQGIIDEAATLALDLAMQRALIRVERPGSAAAVFAGQEMTTIGGGDEGEWDNGRGMERGRNVRLWVFPAVWKWGNESGTGYERKEVVAKAQVLV